MNRGRIHEVRFTRSTTGLPMAAAQARAIADAGDTAFVQPAGERRPAGAYVSKTLDGNYRVEAASLFEPDWLSRLEQVLANGTKENE